tara:strand:+ start:520 stop:795 length:276 start_codon:yes stop_codon:yes gene_type:complete
MVVEDGKATFDQELDFAVRRAEAGGREVGRRGEERRVRDDVVEVKLKHSLGEGGTTARVGLFFFFCPREMTRGSTRVVARARGVLEGSRRG